MLPSLDYRRVAVGSARTLADQSIGMAKAVADVTQDNQGG